MAVNLQMAKREVSDFEEDVDQEIKVKHTVSEEQLMPIEDEYFELLKEDDKFEGGLVNIRQFRNLQMDEPAVVNFYDKDKNLVNRLKAQKGSRQFTVDVFYNSERYTYPLRTRQAERTEVIFKKPHPVVEKHWDERLQRLNTYLDQQLEKIRNNAPNELNHLNENLFVDAELSDVIKANLREVAEALQNLKLRLEKVQYGYMNV